MRAVRKVHRGGSLTSLTITHRVVKGSLEGSSLSEQVSSCYAVRVAVPRFNCHVGADPVAVEVVQRHMRPQPQYGPSIRLVVVHMTTHPQTTT